MVGCCGLFVTPLSSARHSQYSLCEALGPIGYTGRGWAQAGQSALPNSHNILSSALRNPPAGLKKLKQLKAQPFFMRS